MKEVTLELLEQLDFHTYLLDAAGVLYTPEGMVEGAADAVSRLQGLGKQVFLVTNNTSQYVTDISDFFRSHGLYIDADHIITPGLGLQYVPELRLLVEGKRVYVVGRESSKQYVRDAQGRLTTQLSEADVVLLLASHKDRAQMMDEVAQLTDFLTDHEIPVFCLNPDQYVMGRDGRLPVIGYYASLLERQLGRPICWFGKPYSNFSRFILFYLTKTYDIVIDNRVLFIDDNSHNVCQLVRDLNISGCLVKGTGLARDQQRTIQQHADSVAYGIGIFSYSS